MYESDLLDKLKATEYAFSPGALEVLKNSHIPIDDLLPAIKRFWKGEEIKIKEAINIMLTTKQAGASKEIASEIKARRKYVDIPKRFRRTYSILKRFKDPVTAGHIARITHRKKGTEELYLNQLVKLGFVTKTKKARYKIT
ncbi:MAG: hypothetical protein JSV04_01200 [Candidatus Heimdallarchaeota archaeon]|nr:MAG: hypothetical protein JSV04_01200 [Candidatus Heimdallarchaeota archaeon]